jgi:tripartite-type tricarboxylate transporter receptor subunit TctC
VAEQGVPGYDVTSWAGYMAPVGTPRPVVDRLRQAALSAIQWPNVKARLAEMGGEARGNTPEEMKAMVGSELKKWTTIVAEANIPKE